jgi:hypothetical protein
VRNHDSFGPELGGLTAQLAGDEQLSRLLHGLDVFIVRQRLVYRVVPRREYVWLERHLDDELVARLQSPSCRKAKWETSTIRS